MSYGNIVFQILDVTVGHFQLKIYFTKETADRLCNHVTLKQNQIERKKRRLVKLFCITQEFLRQHQQSSVINHRKRQSFDSSYQRALIVSVNSFSPKRLHMINSAPLKRNVHTATAVLLQLSPFRKDLLQNKVS